MFRAQSVDHYCGSHPRNNDPRRHTSTRIDFRWETRFVAGSGESVAVLAVPLRGGRKGYRSAGPCVLFATGVYCIMRFIETPVFTQSVADLLNDEQYWSFRMKKKDFEKLTESIRQAGSIKRGETEPSRMTEFAQVDVKAIRRRLRKSQSEFAHMIGVSVATLQNWEQGRCRPEGPARALLKVAADNPEAVSAALAT